MITGLWNQITMFCGAHQAPLKMTLEEIRGKLVYHCPKAAVDFANSPSACKNDLPLKDFEKMLDKIEDMMNGVNFSLEVVNLEGETFVINKYRYMVIKHIPDVLLHISVINTRYY